MIPAITINAMIEYIRRLNIKRIRKIRRNILGFRELLLNTDYGTISIIYNYNTQSLVASTAKIPVSSNQPIVFKSINNIISNGLVDDISIPNFERILYVNIRKANRYNLILEIFGKGNTILVDNNNKVIYIENPLKSKKRSLVIGEAYQLPKTKKMNPIFFYEEELSKGIINRLENLSIKDLFRVINLDKFTIREALYRSNLPINNAEKVIRREEVSIFINSLLEIMDESKRLNYFSLINNDSLTFLPYKITYTNPIRVFNDYIDAANFYIESLLSRLYKSTKYTDEYLTKLNNQLKKLMDKRRELEDELTEIEEYIPRLYSKIDELLQLFEKIKKGEATNLKVDFENKTVMLPISDKIYLKLKYNENPIKAINMLYETEIKPRKRGLEKLTFRIEELKRLIKEVVHKKTEVKLGIEYRELEKKEWYERFRWFYTSNGFLAVGGRDARSNRILIRKHMADSDLVFHAEYYGSPFVILKDGKQAYKSDIFETAIFTASYSRAWRDGLSSLDVYYVYPSQVSEKPPSGEFLKKGAFMIYGKKNFLRRVPLELCLTFDKDLNKIIVAPCSSITNKNTTNKIYVLTPGGKLKSQVIQGLANEIQKDVYEETGVMFNINNIMDILNSLLPSGGINVRVASKNLFIK